MGNSHTKAETETINWNDVKTDNVIIKSSPHALKGHVNNKNLSVNLNKLINTLKSTETESEYSEDVLNKFMKSKQVKNNNLSDNLSDTSPFISSDIYNYLQNNTESATSVNMTGGGSKKSKKSKKSMKGNDFEEPSSTSATSSTTDLSSTGDSDYSDEVSQNKKTEKKQKHSKNKSVRKTKNYRGTDDMSYNSSSAHTGGEFTSERNVSVTNENNNSNVVSINTSDINMISEY
jgi:hypothetical protein